MATTITWEIEWIKTYPFSEDQTDVVCETGWRCFGLNDVGGDVQHRAEAKGVCSFTYTSGDSFTAFDQLTQNQVLDWVWDSGVDKDFIELNVNKRIDDQINPPIVEQPLPWKSEFAA